MAVPCTTMANCARTSCTVLMDQPSENCSVDTIHLERYFVYDFLHDLVRSVDTAYTGYLFVLFLEYVVVKNPT